VASCQGKAALTWVLLGTGVFLGSLIIDISIPTLLGNVPPNASYGFRTAKTLADPRTWYTANAFASRLTIVAAAVQIVLTVGFALFSVRRGLSQSASAYGAAAVQLVPYALLVLVLIAYNARL
jgi:hypothetical protein